MKFRHVLQDIQTLNERALQGDLDVTAISVAAYPWVNKRYAILACGASIGDGYGPVVVSRKTMTRAQLKKGCIAIPGEMTSAFLALKLWLGDFRCIVVPFNKIFDSVKHGRADAGLIIHEGQLTYPREGFRLTVDLGCWWKQETGLPLPLGVNGIRKDFPPSLARKISCILTASIRYAMTHRAEAIAYARSFGRGLDRRCADRFIGMYVNDFTIDLGARGRRGIREFLKRGRKAGILPPTGPVEFVR